MPSRRSNDRSSTSCNNNVNSSTLTFRTANQTRPLTHTLEYDPTLNDTNNNNNNNDVKNLNSDVNHATTPTAVIFTSIRADCLKICDVNCTSSCLTSSNIYSDGRLYFNACQLLIGILSVLFASTTIVKVFECILSLNEWDGKHECHVMLMIITLLVVNVVAMLVIQYDVMQARKSSFRVSDALVWALMWSGAWPTLLFMLYALNYRIYRRTQDGENKTNTSKYVKLFLVVFTGLTLPAVLMFLISND